MLKPSRELLEGGFRKTLDTDVGEDLLCLEARKLMENQTWKSEYNIP